MKDAPCGAGMGSRLAWAKLPPTRSPQRNRPRSDDGIIIPSVSGNMFFKKGEETNLLYYRKPARLELEHNIRLPEQYLPTECVDSDGHVISMQGRIYSECSTIFAQLLHAHTHGRR